jgi:hypothetical protein
MASATIQMVDDYRYSIGRNVVYRHPSPGRRDAEYGQYGPNRTVGFIRAVELGKAPEHVWVYTIENLRTGEIAKTPETDVMYPIAGKRERRMRDSRADAERLAEDLAKSLSDESPLADFLRMSVEELHSLEESEAIARKEGRDLPIDRSDYIRVRGDLRAEVEAAHNHYAKVLDVSDPDIAAIESRGGVYIVKHKYRVLVDDGREMEIYDPEVKLYYTADRRQVVLNWRAATFLAESFGDDPPYSLEYSYFEDHVFSRDELEVMTREELVSLFAALLYVKGRMGLRDLENKERNLAFAPKEFLVDSVLAISRFDMRRNRNLTPVEVEDKKKDVYRLRRLLRGR